MPRVSMRPLHFPPLVGAAELSADQRRRLVASLFDPWPSLVIGSVALLLVAAISWLRSGSAWFLPWGVACALVLAARTMERNTFNRAGAAADTDRWARRFVLGAWATGLLWGLGGLLVVPLTHDIYVRLLVISVEIGYVTGAAVRNNASPAAASGQVLLGMPLLALGCALTGDPYMAAFGLILVMHTVVSLQIVRNLGGQTLSLMRAEQGLREVNAALSVSCAELWEANARLEALTVTDALTGIANRRAFDAALAAEWARAAREVRPLALLMFDVDHFKAYNDRYGHQAGDECLCQVAGALRRTICRPGEFVGRFGGEEFIVLLPGIDTKGACEVADRIRATVRELRIAHADSPYGVVTVSAGAACHFPIAGMASGVLVAAADRALYRAKRLGRDRLCLAGAASVG